MIDLVDDNLFAIVVDEGQWAGVAVSGFVDLNPLLRNFSVAGALAAAWNRGNVNGARWWAGFEMRLPMGPARETP